MRTDTQRLAPLQDSELDTAQEEIIAPFRNVGAAFGVVRSMARHPRMLTAFRTWATYVMIDKNALPAREREIVALRTAWLIKSGYVWSRHLAYAKSVGLTDEEREATKRPISDHDWSPADVALLKSTDGLVTDFFIPDDAWAELSAHFNEEQCIDVIFVAGHFCMLGAYLNTAGVPIDPDVPLDPELDMRGRSRLSK
jgi:4-carboxymuconolactone decarboxylase